MNRINMVSIGNVEIMGLYSQTGKALRMMDNAGFRLCSLENIAGLKILYDYYVPKGDSSFLNNWPILTSNAVLCLPGTPSAWFIKKSPLLEPQVKFVPDEGIYAEINIAKRKNSEGLCAEEKVEVQLEELRQTNFFPTKKQIISSLTDAVEFPISNKKNSSTFFKFGDAENSQLILSAFGENEKLYQKSLAKEGIDGIRIYDENIDWINAFEVPFIKQVIYGKDETGDMVIKPSIIFSENIFYLWGIKFKK